MNKQWICRKKSNDGSGTIRQHDTYEFVQLVYFWKCIFNIQRVTKLQWKSKLPQLQGDDQTDAGLHSACNNSRRHCGKLIDILCYAKRLDEEGVYVFLHGDTSISRHRYIFNCSKTILLQRPQFLSNESSNFLKVFKREEVYKQGSFEEVYKSSVYINMK